MVTCHINTNYYITRLYVLSLFGGEKQGEQSTRLDPCRFVTSGWTIF